MQIQAPRVFGVMLTEHLVQAGALVPPVLEWCCTQVDHFLLILFHLFSCLIIMIIRISHIFLSHHYDHQIEAEEGRDGIYRLSGQASHIQALKQQFDNGEVCTQIFKQRNCKQNNQ